MALCHGDYGTAQRLIVDALETTETLDDDVLTVANTSGNLGLVALLSDQFDRAANALAAELQLAIRIPYESLQFEALSGLAAVAAAQGEDEVCPRGLGAADVTSLNRHDPDIARQLDDRFFKSCPRARGRTVLAGRVCRRQHNASRASARPRAPSGAPLVPAAQQPVTG